MVRCIVINLGHGDSKNTGVTFSGPSHIPPSHGSLHLGGFRRYYNMITNNGQNGNEAFCLSPIFDQGI